MAELTIRRQTLTTQYYTENLGTDAQGNTIGLDMVQVSGGRFLMGSPEDEPQRRDTEGPQHAVTVPDFFMGRYAVTQAQWRAVAAMPQEKLELKLDPSKFKGANRPVERVNWHEAVEFCARLSTHTGRQYGLPSEAQWEYACRAETTTPFYFGQTITDELANYRATTTYNNGPEGEYRAETVAVDYFGVANAFGLCDMHGNVWEWCADHWHNNYEGAPTDGSAWVTENEGGARVRRGGSWVNNPRLCRSASRVNYQPGDRSNVIGFRVSSLPPGLL